MMKKLLYIGESLLYQFFLIPLLGVFSVVTYYNLVYVNPNMMSFIKILMLFMVLILNIVVLYGMAYVWKNILKVSYMYFVIISIITIFAGI